MNTVLVFVTASLLGLNAGLAADSDVARDSLGDLAPEARAVPLVDGLYRTKDGKGPRPGGELHSWLFELANDNLTPVKPGEKGLSSEFKFDPLTGRVLLTLMYDRDKKEAMTAAIEKLGGEVVPGYEFRDLPKQFSMDRIGCWLPPTSLLALAKRGDIRHIIHVTMPPIPARPARRPKVRQVPSPPSWR